MGREENKLQQARFLAGYLEHGDAKKAYVDSGYEGDPGVGSSIILKRPSVRAWLEETSSRVAETAISTVVEQTKDALQTREGLSEWLVGVIKGETTRVGYTKDGIEIDIGPEWKDRLKAAELLAKIQGHLAPQKHEVTQKTAVFHLVMPNNGRGGEVPREVIVTRTDD